jgi:hypothetical protein
MEDQGIMALPQAGMQAPTTAPMAAPQSEAAIAAFDQARTQMNPKEFGDDLLASAEQMDPAAVQQFKQALANANLPPEVIDALGQMVDTILAEPQNYQEIRAEFIKEGVPEDILPEQFDPNYFGAMNLALDQLSGAAMPMNVQAFAKGGIATLTPVAKMLAAQGRNGDTMLAHITPAEARMLRRQGGSGTINPVTGLPEFFIKKVFKAAGSVLKSVGDAVTGAVKSVAGAVKSFAQSSVGKIVTAVALGFFLGPAAATMMGVSSAAGVAAMSGFIGGAGSTLLAGGNIKDALKAGAIGGLTAGATAGVTGGMNAFEAGSYTGPTTVAGQVDRFTDSLRSLTGAPAASEVSSSALDYTGTGDVIPGSAPAIQPPTVPAAQMAPPTVGAEAFPVSGAEPFSYQPSFGEPVQYAGSTVPSSAFGAPQAPNVAQGIQVPGQVADASRYQLFDSSLTGGGQGFQMPSGSSDFLRYSGQTPGVMESLGQAGSNLSSGNYLDAAKNAGTALFGTPTRAIATTLGGLYLTGGFNPEEQEAPGIVPRESGFDLYKQNPEQYGVTPGGASMNYADTAGYGQMGNPFMAPQFQVRDPRQYLPPMGLAALRPQGFFLGGLASKIGAVVRKMPAEGTEASASTPPAQPQQASGGFRGIGGLLRRLLSQGQLAEAMRKGSGLAVAAPRQFNTGGYAKGGGIRTLAQRYPRRTGQISGPGTETSDSIPAMLSDGEFVMTARAVRGAGGGSRRDGAKRMYDMMRKFERKA